ncbi:trichothecene 3-O-acetyltransferase [Melanomma pulvis-pyrius CBS 109.77]|uniref:Trichothecene 3-O-acetyltransferase n=1 Tax=Melanomma pulvis-pyrius CBS 109.77 TaxID=1314802 RepID=A0A6A6WP64_9PLEO|nr:trichothecene 3-O-acetyltransferase [Melanomma pulvis-pyrius CBS 109.77]
MTSLNMDLDILGEQPALFRLYTQLLFIFPLTISTTQESITLTIKRGLERLSKSFPWIAGQVVNLGPEPHGSDIFKIITFDTMPRLVVKDYTSDGSVPSLEDLREAEFPFSMLGEEVWAPCPTIAGLSFDPTKPSGSSSEPAPVFLLQISFIRGGMVLCVNAQHNVMDMTGQGHVIALLSKACRGGEFMDEEVRIGNMERKNMIPLLGGDWRPGPELEMQILKEEKEKEKEAAPAPDIISNPKPNFPPKCRWSYFTFSASSLQSLKSLSTTTLPQGTSYITTDDALSAFVFQSVLRARSTRLDPNATVKFARAIDVRKSLSIPPSYPGILQNMTYHSYTLSALLSLPLGEIAAEMRKHVDVAKLAYATRSLATFLQSEPGNRHKANFTAKMNPEKDVMLSSWSKIEGYGLDFGLGLGMPVAVRRPRFVPVESLFYLMPKGLNGEIALAACLREGDLERLRGDGEFVGVGKYVG